MPNLPLGVMELARLHIGANYVGQLSSAHDVTAGQIRSQLGQQTIGAILILPITMQCLSSSPVIFR
jgi:hypothetical protein